MTPEYRPPCPREAIKDILKFPLERLYFRRPELQNDLQLLVERDTPILASRAGIIVEAEEGDIEHIVNDEEAIHRTNRVTVDHGDDTYAVYVHVKPIVKKGQKVKTGERLGQLGGYGSQYTVHLHFKVFQIQDGIPVSMPVEFVGRK